MKKGDKFKVGDKEYTLEDMEKLVDTMKNKDVQEKAKPRLYRFRQRRKQNRAHEESG